MKNVDNCCHWLGYQILFFFLTVNPFNNNIFDIALIKNERKLKLTHSSETKLWSKIKELVILK